MIGFAENLDFEEAARVRDEIKNLESKELEIIGN
jgi:protein-arginine kinase activator protein McsA